MKGLVVMAAVLASMGAALLWMSDGARGRVGVYPPGSSNDASPSGLSQARAYLRARGALVDALTRPLVMTPPDANAVVFRVEPQRTIDGPRGVVTSAREEEWVRRGGRLVLAIDGAWGGLRTRPAAGPARSVFPGWPDFSPPTTSALSHLPAGAHALALAAGAPVLARVPLGQGEIILLASPGALQNRGLAAAGNLALLERLVAGRRTVLFDEDSHGLGHSLGVLDVLLEHGLGPALLLAALAGAAGAARARTRLGPPDPDVEDTRSDAVDLVASLAHLYGRAMPRPEALRLYREAYAQAVRQATGLTGRPLQERVRARLAGPAASPATTASGGQFAAHLRSINQAFAELPGRRAGETSSRRPLQEVRR